MRNTCCPQYTIRLDAVKFAPEKDKKMRKLLSRWERFIVDGRRPGGEGDERPDEPMSGKGKQPAVKGKPWVKGQRCVLTLCKARYHSPTSLFSTQPPAHDFLATVHAPEISQAGPSVAHRYEVELVPAKPTKEAFELYDKYQISVHGDKPGHNSLTGFNRFLCRNPLGVSQRARSSNRADAQPNQKQRIAYPNQSRPAHLPAHYGCFHQRKPSLCQPLKLH